MEGPKYSTCRCTLPALSIEDLANSDSASGGGLRMFSGMLSKGSSVAGGIAGGLMRASTAAVYSGSNSNGTPSKSSNDSVPTDGSISAVRQHHFSDE